MSSRSRLLVALSLVTCVAIVEFWGGARAGSLALLTDAVHVCMDVFALALAFVALVGAARPANARKTYGYGRIEMLGALINGALLLGAVIFIVYEAIGRFMHPSLPHGSLMSAVAAFGLIVNLGVGMLLLRDGKHNLNIQAALFHVAGDAIGAVAVLIGGFIILATKAAWIDPLLSLIVACVIVTGVYRVLRDASDVLLEGTPRGVDISDVARSMKGVPGVVAVHDLHVWSISSDERALSAHVQIDDRRVSEASDVVREITARVQEAFGVGHATLQLECDNCAPNTDIVCTKLST